jgi:hypothetical protein
MNILVKEYLSLKGRRFDKTGEKCIIKRFMVYNLPNGIIRKISSSMRWARFVEWRRKERPLGFWLEI